LYPVDHTRVNEYGQSFDESEAKEESKKDKWSGDLLLEAGKICCKVLFLVISLSAALSWTKSMHFFFKHLIMFLNKFGILMLWAPPFLPNEIPCFFLPFRLDLREVGYPKSFRSPTGKTYFICIVKTIFTQMSFLRHTTKLKCSYE
jgi:hypothetical protein